MPVIAKLGSHEFFTQAVLHQLANRDERLHPVFPLIGRLAQLDLRRLTYPGNRAEPIKQARGQMFRLMVERTEEAAQVSLTLALNCRQCR